MNRPKVGLAIFVFNSDTNKFLIGKRIPDNEYGLPGGKLEFGESFEQCGKRELYEETNLNIDESRFKYLCSYNCIYKEKNFHWVEIFLIVHITKDEEYTIHNNEPLKCEEWMWVNFEEFENNEEIYFPLKSFFKKFKIQSIQNILGLRAP